MGSAQQIDVTPPLAGDPWQAWLDAHRAEVARYRGQRIAVHRTEGIIASGATYEALSEALTRMGYPPGEDDDIAIEVVPRSFVGRGSG